MSLTLLAALGGSSATSGLYSVDPATGAMTLIGPIGFALTGIAQDPTTRTIYGITSNQSAAHPHSLITIDPTTGAGTFIAAEGGPNTPWTDIAFDSSGNLYAQGQSTFLMSVNKASGVGTPIGPSAGSFTTGGALAINSLDAGFGDPRGGSRPYSIDLSTGIYTPLSFYIGSPGGTPNAASFDGSDVFWTIFGSGPGYTLCTVDLSTSSVTVIGTMLSKSDALAWCNLTPITDDFSVTLTPSSLTLLDGQSGTTDLSTAITLGSAQSITLSATGAPAGVTLGYSINPIMSGGPDSLITVSVSSAVAAGTYHIVIRAVGTGATHVATLTLTVEFSENFDSGGANTDKWDCSNATNAFVTSDGASEGPYSFKVDAWNADAFLVADPLPPMPADGQWVYTSFALYIPSWATMWDGGNAWDPYVISLSDEFGPFTQGFYIQPLSPTTGVIEWHVGGGTYFDSDLVPDGAWVAVECARKYTLAGNLVSIQYWINNVSSGGIQSGSGGLPTRALDIGSPSWGGPPPTAAQLLYYMDDFRWALSRIGPVDLSAAFFHGVGSGVDNPPCTTVVTPHPVNDSYTVLENRTLNVPAPGVMINDILPTTVSLNTGPAHGTLILNADGSFSYTPNLNYAGVDSFVYNGNGGTATATITVTAFGGGRAVFDGVPAIAVGA